MAELFKLKRTKKETFTIDYWTGIDDAEPFILFAELTLATPLNDNSIITLSMDAVTQATYGIVLGGVNGQVVTLYAAETITTPSTIITVDILVGA